MRKINFIKLGVLVIIVVIALYELVSFADGKSTGIISISSEKIAPNENFYLILNLSNIQYNNFKVDIINTKKLELQETTGRVSKMSSNNVVTSFIIDKTTVGLEKLGVVFEAPQDEGVINFDVKITSLDKTTDTLKSDLDNITNEIENLKENLQTIENALIGEIDTESDEYKEAIEIKTNLENTIVLREEEKVKLEKEIEVFEPESLNAKASIEVLNGAGGSNFNTDMSGGNMLNKNQITNTTNMEREMDMMKDRIKEMDNMSEKMSSLERTLKDANDTISSLSKGTTYPGSSNNYLSILSVSGYELDNEFNKTTNDYFITVDKNVTKLAVSAKAEIASATVTVEGNNNIKDGQNKILVNVTAEDGSVRTYRVYVTK